MEAPRPKPMRPLRRLYREKLVSALALLIAKSEGLAVSEDQLVWAHLRLIDFLDDVMSQDDIRDWATEDDADGN